MKMEMFYEKLDKECTNVPILKYYDSFQFFQRLSCASNEDIMTIKEKLINRAAKNKELLKVESKNLDNIRQIIDDYVSEKENSINIVMLKEFSKALSEIIIDLQS